MLPRAWLSKRARVAMFNEASEQYPLETGGVLIGYWNEGDVVIVEAVGPGPRAHHGRGSFEPDQVFHETAVADRYRDSQFRNSYLGDWHSHPNGAGRLSRMDVAALRKISLFQLARAPTPLMMIVHGTSSHWDATTHCLIPTPIERTPRPRILPLVPFE